MKPVLNLKPLINDKLEGNASMLHGNGVLSTNTPRAGTPEVLSNVWDVCV